MLTVDTHKGFNRLPFGVKVASSIFQQIMATMVSGLDFFFISYLDDVYIKRKNRRQHSEHIQQVLQKIEDYGSKFGEGK